MDEQVFQQCENVRKNQTLVLILMLITIPIMILVMFLFIFNLSLLLAIIASLALDLMILIQFKFITSEKNKLSLILTNEFIERKSGEFTEKINFHDVKEAKIYRNKQDDVTLINVYSGKNKIGLISFKDMNKIGDILTQQIPPQKIERKVQQIEPVNLPLFYIISSILIFGIILYMLETSMSVYDFSRNVFFATSGIYLLFFKPLSTYLTMKNRKFEIIFGTILILDGIISLFYNWRG